MNKKSNILALVLNLAIVIMEIIALFMSFKRNGILSFQFYTEDSNIFAMIISFVFVIFLIGYMTGKFRTIPKAVRILRFTSTCCLTVTFIVVVCVLAPFAGMGGYEALMLKNSMLYHHFLCPVAAFVSFLLFEKNDDISFKQIGYTMIPTILYAAISIVLNIKKVIVGPYPFLRVYDQPVYMSVVWFIVIVGGAYLIGILLWKLNRVKKQD